MRPVAMLLPLALFTAAPLVAAETVPVPAFRSIQLRGGGNVVVRPGPVQRVTLVEGSSQFTTFRVNRNRQLTIDACNDRCPRHYNLQIVVEVPQAPDLAVMGGGAITASPGFALDNDLAVAVDGGGLIDVRAITAREVSAAVSGGGKILVGRSSDLAAAVHGGGAIRYAGNPQVSTAIAGGGSVERAD
jgi:hypothetical protein